MTDERLKKLHQNQIREFYYAYNNLINLMTHQTQADLIQVPSNTMHVSNL